MKQYCRYCAHALDYNGEATDFLCEADAPCGNNGAGEFYPASKAKWPNKCKHFIFNQNDIFRCNPDGSFVEYRPRDNASRPELPEKAEQMTIGGAI